MPASTVTLTTDPIATFRAEVIERAMAHGQMHIDRAIDRNIWAPDVEAAELLFMLALLALSEAESEADRATTLTAAHAALSEWKATLESLANGRLSLFTDQCVELDQGELRSLLRCVAGLDHLASAECRATRTREQILIDLAAEGFACPPHPEVEDV